MGSKLLFAAVCFGVLHCSTDQLGRETQVKSLRSLDSGNEKTAEIAVSVEASSHDPDFDKDQSLPKHIENSPQVGRQQDAVPTEPTINTEKKLVVNQSEKNGPMTPPEEHDLPPPPSLNPASNPRPGIANVNPPSSSPSVIIPDRFTPTMEQKPGNSLGGLPDVVIDSEKALTPMSALSPPAAGNGTLQALFKFENLSGSQPNGIFLACTSIMRLEGGALTQYNIQCDHVDRNRQSVALKPKDYSWKFTLTNCPKLSFQGNFFGSSCSLSKTSRCAPVYPATRLDINDADLDACAARRSELIYTVLDKSTGKITSLALTLTKSAPTADGEMPVSSL